MQIIYMLEKPNKVNHVALYFPLNLIDEVINPYDKRRSYSYPPPHTHTKGISYMGCIYLKVR